MEQSKGCMVGPEEWHCRVGQCKEVPADAIRKERGSRYGDITINHSSIGAIWGGILLQAMSGGRWVPGNTVPPEVVCLMMAGVKLSRESYAHTPDNIVDGKIYLDFVGELS
jgi:hypothetical protein